MGRKYGRSLSLNAFYDAGDGRKIAVNMKLDQEFFDTWTPRALAILRIVVAFLYLQHGTAKLLGVPHVADFDQLPALSLIGFAGLLEIVGSLLIFLGLFTRPTAFILSGEMAVAVLGASMRTELALMRMCEAALDIDHTSAYPEFSAAAARASFSIR